MNDLKPPVHTAKSIVTAIPDKATNVYALHASLQRVGTSQFYQTVHPRQENEARVKTCFDDVTLYS